MTIEAVLSGAARYAVVCGDNREILPTLADRCVDHVITDPPYEAEAHTKGRRIRGKVIAPGVRVIRDAPLSFPPMVEADRRMVGTELARLASRWCLVFCQAEGAHLWRDAVPLRSMRWCVWVKPDGQPQYTGDRPGVGYETIVAMHRPGRARWNGGGRVGVFTHNSLTGARTAANAKVHPAEKPLPLMLELISLFTDPGDVVLDPYCGSATTGVACLRLGRRFIGCEVSEKWAALSRERCEAELANTTLQASRAGQLPLLGGAG